MIEHSRSSNFSASLVKNIPYIGLGLSISCKRLYSCGALQKGRGRKPTPRAEELCEGIKSNSSEEASLTANIHIDGVQHNLGDVGGADGKGTQGTPKTSHGNKGKIPWNKGRKHSEGNYFLRGNLF